LNWNNLRFRHVSMPCKRDLAVVLCTWIQSFWFLLRKPELQQTKIPLFISTLLYILVDTTMHSYIIGWSNRYIVAQHVDGLSCHLVQGSVNFRPTLFVRVTGLAANAWTSCHCFLDVKPVPVKQIWAKWYVHHVKGSCIKDVCKKGEEGKADGGGGVQRKQTSAYLSHVDLEDRAVCVSACKLEP